MLQTTAIYKKKIHTLCPNSFNSQTVIRLYLDLECAKQKLKQFDVEIIFAQCMPVQNCSDNECRTAGHCQHVTAKPIINFQGRSPASEDLFDLWCQIISFCESQRIFTPKNQLYALQLAIYKLE
jgi:hypothetical protein